MITFCRDGVWRSYGEPDVPLVNPCKALPDKQELMTQEEMRAMWRSFWRDRPSLLPYAADVLAWSRCELLLKGCSDLRCGSKTRAGHACKKYHLYPNGRCRLHGGLSSGPRTAAGKAKVTKNLKIHIRTGEEI